MQSCIIFEIQSQLLSHKFFLQSMNHTKKKLRDHILNDDDFLKSACIRWQFPVFEARPGLADEGGPSVNQKHKKKSLYIIYVHFGFKL